MTSQPKKQTIATHILPNVSRSKANLTMKFGHLTEHKMRKLFLEKLNTRCRGEAIRRSFSKNQN